MNARIIPILLAALWLLPCTSSAQLNNRLDAIQAIQQGDMQLRLGNSEQALLAYTNAIQMDMGFADAYMKRAALLSRLGQYTQAMADLDRALELNPYSEHIFDRRAKVKLLMNDSKGFLGEWPGRDRLAAGTRAAGPIAPPETRYRVARHE
jgi:tetratricopeptide (TPR) repeat protein